MLVKVMMWVLVTESTPRSRARTKQERFMRKYLSLMIINYWKLIQFIKLINCPIIEIIIMFKFHFSQVYRIFIFIEVYHVYCCEQILHH